MRLLARIGIARKVFDDAELLLAAVLELAPDIARARRIRRGAHRAAPVPRSAPATRPLSAGGARKPAIFRGCMRPLRWPRRARTGRGAVPGSARETPADADVHLSIAHALKTLASARRQSHPIARRRPAAPNFGDAYWSLANLKTYRFTDEELARHARRPGGAGDWRRDRFHLCFALGKALEDRGEFAESFRYYELGNALKRAAEQLSPGDHRDQYAPADRGVHAASSSPAARAGAPGPDPIFIVGLPRSGSTLLEQILASHSQVEGTQELSNVQQIVARPSGPRSGPEQSALPADTGRAQRGGLRHAR